VRSYFVADWVSCSRAIERGGSEYTEWLSLTGAGRVRLSWRSWQFNRSLGWRGKWEWSRERHPTGNVATSWFDMSSPLGRVGFGWFADDDVDATTARIRQRAVTFPLWLPAVLLALLPAVRLYRRIRRPFAAGLCQRCGYDLRATPGRCPECGEAA
jgi:hypothetical protein